MRGIAYASEVGGNSGCQRAGKPKMNPSPDRPALNPKERDLPAAFSPTSSFRFQPQHTDTRSQLVVLPPSF